jgi:hypothetical protein
MIKKKQYCDQSDGGAGASFSGLIDELAHDHKQKLRELEAEYRQKVREARKIASSVTRKKVASSSSRGQEDFLLREKVAFLELQEKELRKQIDSLTKSPRGPAAGAAERQDTETPYHRQGMEHDDTRDGGGIIDLVDNKLDDRDLETSGFKSTLTAKKWDGSHSTAVSPGKLTEQTRAESELVALKRETKDQKQLVSKLLRELKSLKASHEAYVKTAEESKEKACEEARDELIRRVEIQFQQANDVYVKLKKKYQESQEKIKTCEADMKEAIAGLDLAISEKDRLESELSSQLEKNASLERKMSRMEAKHNKEMKEILKATKDLKGQLINAENSSRMARKTMEYTIIERDLLQEKIDTAKIGRPQKSPQLDGVLKEREHLRVELQVAVNERDELKHLCGELVAKLKNLEDKSAAVRRR